MIHLKKLQETVQLLRAPGGCPWDIQQTHASLINCLIEEASEVIQAIENKDDENLREELGDLLLQVIMHAQIATEEGRFNLEDVARGINEKLIRRHPHVFGDNPSSLNTDGVLKQWEEIKAEENKGKKQSTSLFKGKPPQLSALLFSTAIFKQIEKNNFPIDDHINSSHCETQAKSLNEQTAGKELFELIASCRKANIDPEQALRNFTKQIMDSIEENNHS